MTEFIRKKYDVENPEETAVHKLGGQAGDRERFSLQSGLLFLVGLRGSGKSTVGRAVADRLGLRFVDLDDLIEKRVGKTIARIVQDSGWEAFRTLEHAALEEVCATSGAVVAPGGGVVLDERNRALLESGGKIFYLMADVPVLKARLEKDPNFSQRPALSDKSLEEEILDSFREREPLYMMLMDFGLPADLPVEELVDQVVSYLEGR